MSKGEFELQTAILLELGGGRVDDKRLQQAPELAFAWIQLLSEDIERQLDEYRELARLVRGDESIRRPERFRRIRKYEREYNVELTPEFVETRLESCLEELDALGTVIEACDAANVEPLFFFAASQVEITEQELESLSRQSKMADVSQSVERAHAWLHFWRYVIHALDHSQRESELTRAVVKRRD